MAGGLGGLGGYVSSPGFGNILQAVGMSMMSSPRSNPLQNMGKFYGDLRDQQYKEDEQDQQRGAIAAVLKSAGFSDDEAMQLSFNPQAAKLAIEQRQAQQQREADASFMSGAPSFGGIGGAPDATQPGAGDVSAFPAVSDASGPQIERTPLPAPTQTLFGLPGAAQADYSHFRADAAPPSDNYLEPVESIPQQPVQPKPSGNRTMDWLKENDPEAHALVSEENGITPRDAYEISVIRKQAQKQADESQSQLDQLYKYRDQYAQWPASAPNDKTYDKAKRGLDNIDNQIARLEKQIASPKLTDDMREYEMARDQGFDGSFMDYMVKMKEAGRNQVNIDTGVKLPTGYRWADPTDQTKGVEPIPGGPANVLPSEAAGRIGLADSFLNNFASIRSKVASGQVTGPIDRFKATNDSSSEGAETYRQIQTGVDSLQRMLTGAGMPQSEAAQYAFRYLPTYTDDADSMVKKLDRLKAELEGVQKRVMQGRGSPSEVPPPGNTSPAAPEGVTEDDIRFTMDKYGISREEVLRRLADQ